MSEGARELGGRPCCFKSNCRLDVGRAMGRCGCSAQRRRGNGEAPLHNEGESNLNKRFCLSANNYRRLIKETDSGCALGKLWRAPRNPLPQSTRPRSWSGYQRLNVSTLPRRLRRLYGLTISFHRGSQHAEEVRGNVMGTLQYGNVYIVQPACPTSIFFVLSRQYESFVTVGICHTLG
jgi:hypothetical protein